jgi:RNA polymerase sigma-70 factor, ECF subfamily
LILVDLLEAFMDQMESFVRRDPKWPCDQEMAHDAIVDVLLSYVETPERYNPARARLVSYLTKAAKYRVRDRLKSRSSESEREQNHASVVELWRSSPKDILENSVEAARVMDQLKNHLDEKDLIALHLFLSQERSSLVWAQTLGLDTSDEERMQQEVKRIKDRLMKILQRFGKEDPDDHPA